MNSAKWFVVMGSVLAFGLVCGATLFNAPASAQVPAAAPAPDAAPAPAAAPQPAGRYQISAYGAGNSVHGCYLVDTATGNVWHSSSASAFRLVPKYKPKPPLPAEAPEDVIRK